MRLPKLSIFVTLFVGNCRDKHGKALFNLLPNGNYNAFEVLPPWLHTIRNLVRLSRFHLHLQAEVHASWK